MAFAMRAISGLFFASGRIAAWSRGCVFLFYWLLTTVYCLLIPVLPLDDSFGASVECFAVPS
jgi:hypothetical protein